MVRQIQQRGGELHCNTTSLMTYLYCLQFLVQLPCWVSAVLLLIGSLLPANCRYAGLVGVSMSSPQGCKSS